ncbi:MAG: TPD domain-containing protein [Candidatus Diapherotrites archaeon]|nr:TPD domain-containing protein [Candidatus Diapherotrites archaeon]
MDIEEYKKLYRELDCYDDVKRLVKKYKGKYDEELLFVIFTQKHIREVKRKYYQVGNQSQKLLSEWKKGKSFTQLAREHKFSPVMMTQILLKAKGLTKKEALSIMRDYENCKDRRLKTEIKDAIEKDMVYSTVGNALQRERGKQGEANIQKWLDAQGITYRTEKDLRGKFPKTVDFLLDKPFKVKFQTHPDKPRLVYWIESKGSFGDTRQIRRDYREQLSKYVEMWGPGMVVYWFDYLDGLELWLEARDVKLVKRSFFEHAKIKKQTKEKTKNGRKRKPKQRTRKAKNTASK